MSEPNQEPTMEEILASIRRIISEDDAPPEAEAAAEPQDIPSTAAPEPEAHAVIEEPAQALLEEEDEVLELTERVAGDDDLPEETLGDLDVYAAPPDMPPTPTMPPRPGPRIMDDDGPLIGRVAEQSAASAFGHLAQSINMPREGRTLEDVVRELLRPLLKEWLDEHLPRIVHATVQAEVERIARGGSH